MKLSFKRGENYWGVTGHCDAVIPINEFGEEIEGIESCQVESTLDNFTRMHITVLVQTNHPEEKDVIKIERQWAKDNLTPQQIADLMTKRLMEGTI